MDVGSTPVEIRVLVVGVGGGGGRAVLAMVHAGLTGAEFLVVDTDAAALAVHDVRRRLFIGTRTTQGVGAAGDPAAGAAAAREAGDRLVERVADADVVIVVAGLGGGTGTGAAPVVAAIARDAGARTVAIVTCPFGFEGRSRVARAESALAVLRKRVDARIMVRMPGLRVGDGVSSCEAFRRVDAAMVGATREVMREARTQVYYGFWCNGAVASAAADGVTSVGAATGAVQGRTYLFDGTRSPGAADAVGTGEGRGATAARHVLRPPAQVRVVAVGGIGGQALAALIDAGLAGGDAIAIDTDAVALDPIRTSRRLRLPLDEVFEEEDEQPPWLQAPRDRLRAVASAALDEADAITAHLRGADVVVLVAGIGGRTGTGAAPVVADIARAGGALTVGVVMQPLGIEPSERRRPADAAMVRLAENVDVLLPLEDPRWIDAPVDDRRRALEGVTEMMVRAVQSVVELVRAVQRAGHPPEVVRTVLTTRGRTRIGSRGATGENRALFAAMRALEAPQFHDVRRFGPTRVWVHVHSDRQLPEYDLHEAVSFVRDQISERVEAWWMLVLDDALVDEARVTVLATGCQPYPSPDAAPRTHPRPPHLPPARWLAVPPADRVPRWDSDEHIRRWRPVQPASAPLRWVAG
jgi:cell division protein FtsZ